MIAAEGGVLDPHGPVAASMEELWWFMLVLGVVAFVIFMAVLVVGARRGDAEVEDHEAHERRLVQRFIGLGGVAFPVVVIVAVFAATLGAMRTTSNDAPPDALEIEITGHQFWYEVRYPEAGLVTANELHIPTGQPVVLRLRSADVIHAFWVPALGGKMDMLPERTNTLVLQADQTGEHRSRCAEFCGLQHAKMVLSVVAETPEDFERWLSSQLEFSAREGDLAQRGQEVFVSADCVSCHALRGQEPTTDAPDLTTLPDRATLAAATLPNSRENLAEWIVDPQAIKPGADMPPAELSEADLEALLAYLGATR